MKKKVFSLMMMLLLAVTGFVRADELTVHDGTATNAYVPVYGFYADAYLKCEMVYPASELSAMNGGQINSLSFGISTPATDAWTATFEVFVKEVSDATISAFTGTTGATTVYTGTLDGTGSTMTVNFTAPYTYNGGNLLVGFYLTNKGNYKSITWAGETVSGASFQGYSYTSLDEVSGSQRDFLPKTTFDYTPAGGGGGEAGELIVHDGTENNGYIPMYGGYFDDYTKSECVFPAGELSAMNGGTINAVTFYVNSVGSQLNGWGSTQQVFLKEVDNATISSFYGTDGATIVYEGTLTAPTAAGDELVINFTTPYQYNGGNLLLGVYNTSDGTYQFVYFVGETVNGASGAGSNASSLAGVSFTQRNFLPKTRFSYTTAGGDTPGFDAGLHTYATYGVGEEVEEMMDFLYIERPNGAWMEPYHFQLYNDGAEDVDVLYIDFLHNNGYFSMDEETTEYPFTVPNTGLAGAVDLYINTNTDWTDTEEINSLLAVNTNERSTHLYEIVAAPYEPYCPDVVEKAYNIGTLTNGEWRMYASDMWEEENSEADYNLHANYDMPDFEENIPDGYDAVMKFTVDHDVMLNAYVNDGENGKVALYRSDFAGEAGPMADNNYEGRPFTNTSGGGGASGEITVHDGTVTNGYVPVYGFYADAYLKCEMVYTASELSAMTGSDINSMKFYLSSPASDSWGNANFQVFLTEVANNTIDAFYGPGTVVYQGALDGTQPEMTINFTTPYHYNGGNLLVGIYNTVIGSYKSCAFYGETINGASLQGYNYSSLSSVTGYQRNFLPKTTFAYGSRSNRDVILAEGFENGLNGWTMSNCHSSTGTTTTTSYVHTGSSAFTFHWTTTPPQYLISPELTGTDNGVDVEFYYKAGSTGSYSETFKVGYSTSTDAVSAFTFGEEITALANTDWATYTNSFPAGTKYVAIQCTSNNALYFCLDDFTFTAPNGPVGPGQSTSFSAGPVIENLNVLAGTYYLLASSTDEDFEVVINAEDLPCPIAPVTNIYPADNALDIPANNLTLQWTLNDYCNEWRLVFSSTYWPEDEIDTEHPATYVTEWSSNLQESFNISAALAANGEQLWENTNYFWRIEQRSNPGTDYECYTTGPVFGFTTSFDVPQNLQVNGGITAQIFETEEDVTLTWNRIYDRNRDNDRTFRRYRIYWNGEFYDETTENDVNEVSYTIPNSEFHYNMVPRTPEEFNVTAVYDEGESPISNTVHVEVSGYGTISGTVYEQDEITPIGGVTVVVTGTNEFGGAEEYTFTTDDQGFYQGQVHVGEYSDAMAYMDGYQEVQTTHSLPFNVVYQQTTPNVDFIMDETFYYPAHVCAHTVYVPGVQGDTLVQVWWEGWASEGGGFVPGGAFEAQIGDGTGTLTYAPFHTLWNYSLSETLYRADELAEAGVTGAAMTSLSYYVASTSCTTPQNNISIWMANVPDNELSTTSYTTNNMTLVYTGNNVLPVAGQWNEFVFNEGNFSWDGQSNIVILCTRNNGSWQGSVSWQTHNPGFLATTYAYSDTNNGYNVATTPETGMYTSSTNRPNIIMKAGGREAAIGENRALHHFNIYRTDCYNNGPYNSDNTEFLASVWRPDTSYVDVQWPEVPVGVYKYGVSAVYSGNQADNPNNPRVDYPFEERESEIMWSDQCGPCIDKDMQTDITVNVVCNSADSPEGCVVSFTNLNEGEQFNHPQPSITLDGSGFQAVTPFRKGNYLVTVYLPGYELLQVEESIWGHRDLRYVLTEIIYGVKNLYVSRTGWAMWEPETWEDYPIPSGAVVGPTVIDFETGDFSQYAFTNTSAYAWTVVNEGRGYCMKSGNAGIASSTSTISATMNYTMDGTVEFDANCMGEGTSTFWDKCIFKIDGAQMFSHGADVTGWHNYSYPVMAGEHTFTWEYSKDGSVNPTGDCFLVDNINFNIGGSRAVAEERHLEGYKIMCTSLDDEPIFNHNTPVDQPFCQLTTVDPWSGQPMLIEGERYKVKVATIYSTGQSPWSEAVIWQYEPCDHWGPVDEVTAGTMPQGNHIEWVFEHGHNQWIDPNDPGQGGEASAFLEDCDAGIPAGWTTIDADGDGLTWVSSMNPGVYHNAGVDLTGTGHNSSNAYVISGSYANQTGAVLYPDNYFVSPQVTLGGSFSFFACAQDATYAAEHFGVAVSTTGTAAADFTTIQEWTLTAKSGGNMMSAGRHGTRAQGNWYEYTVDLSAYAGQAGYVAIRHFNCHDQFILNIDDLAMNAENGAKGGGLGFAAGGEFYRQYAEDGIMLNFLALDNVDFRAYMLFNLVKDNRFSLMAESQYGEFVLTPAFDMDNFMSEFEGFYEETSYNFSLLSKMDIYSRMNEWKNSVGSQNFLSITMDVAFNNARVENDQCINSLPFCTSDVIEFEAANTSSQAQEEGMDDGCIGMSYNPSFYHMRIHEAGPFVIHMEGHDPNNGTTRDIDFCMWGPYTEQEVLSGYACTHLTGDKIMDCNYSASYTEDCFLGYPEGQHQHSTGHGNVNYHVPAVGEYYILMITNYSQQPCVINFTKTEGDGETDCDIVTPTDLIGFLITLDGEYLTIVGPDEREYTHDGEFGDHEYCVRPIYPGPAILSDTNYYFSMGCPVCASTNGDVTCEPGNPIYAEVNNTDDQVHIWWSEQPTPPEPEEGDTFMYDFENGSLEGLILIDNDGDGYNWNLASATMGTGNGHNGSADMVFSQSYDNNFGALTPDNFIVFPQSNIVNGSTFSFWACAQDNGWAAEHFGVAVSTSGTNASDFTTIQEWTMTAKGGAKAVRDGRDQGTWYNYTVDLSDYAGMPVYIAIRHFNSTDMFYIDVDDVELGIANKRNRDGIIGYNIYRSTDNVDYVLIATVDGDVTEYFDAPGAGTYYYQVTALYEGCESDPAISGLYPEQNYVMVGVDAVGENSANVNLFPNPTKGNVTIQAMNMHRITVVSVLGQVVFDTELDQDEYILNMAKFNTGMYMVRVYTDEGVTVKRVTVLH